MGEHKLEDEELLRRIAEKDLKAFQQLVERHNIFVFTTCCNLIGDFHQAEEAAQDVFLQIYRSAGSFRKESKVSTWIYRIAVNRSLNTLRRSKRSRWLESLSTLKKEEAGGEEPGRLLETEEMEEFLKRALDFLPEKQKAAFVLHKYNGLSPGEIAEILGVSPNTVEVRLHRAKKNLQKYIVPRLKKTF